jgi:kynurenine formamidase
VRVTEPPRYRDLPPAPRGGRSGWGVFGPDDNLGLVNLMTPERVAAAARLVRAGRMFPLDLPSGSIAPALARSRGTPRHTVVHQPGTIGFDDLYDNLYPQAGSQWDALGHIGYAPDEFYNGATEADVQAGRRNTIDHWARHGIAGRAVLLDISRAMAEAGRGYQPGEATPIGIEELELARRRTGLEIGTGDIVLLHTGFASWYFQQPRPVRDHLPASLAAPGLAHNEDVVEYLWDSRVAAIAADTFAVEAWPADRDPAAHPAGFLHRLLIGQLGMAVGELWWLADLAKACAADGVYECFLVSTPMNAPGGIGSPANAVAIK